MNLVEMGDESHHFYRQQNVGLSDLIMAKKVEESLLQPSSVIGKVAQYKHYEGPKFCEFDQDNSA